MQKYKYMRIFLKFENNCLQISPLLSFNLNIIYFQFYYILKIYIIVIRKYYNVAEFESVGIYSIFPE